MSEDLKQAPLSIPHGFSIIGICLGSKVIQDGNYTNNNIYIQTGTRPNEIGDEEKVIETISVFGDGMHLMEKANQMIGKTVVIPVTRRPARRDMRDAYMRNSINRNSDLLVIKQ